MIHTHSYEKEYIQPCSKKDHPLLFLYPTSLFLFDKFKLHSLFLNHNTSRILESLNVGEDKNFHIRLYWCKKCSCILMLLCIISIFSMLNELSLIGKGELIGENSLKRPAYGEGDKKVHLHVEVKDKKEVIKDELDINVNERRYDTGTMMKNLEEARTYIDAHILGRNKSPEDIQYPIVLVNKIPETSIKIKWKLDDKNIIDSQGNLNNENISKEGELVQITAQIEYYETVENYQINLVVRPKIISGKERIINNLKKIIDSRSKDTLTQELQVLPESIEGKTIHYNEPDRKISGKIFFAGVILTGILYFFFDKELLNQDKKREAQVLIDYPDIINKFVLLLGAGMTMKNAWGKIVAEYAAKKSKEVKYKRYAYEEMVITYHEISNGVMETKAYEDYGRRMRALPYLRFSSLISQNLKKGTKGLLELLEYESGEAFNERKELAKRLGEEASTKLLFPMILMLLIVLAIIMVPALLGL